MTKLNEKEPPFDLKTMGQRIGSLLQALGISQAELASQLPPTAKSTVSNWVQGKALIDTRGLIRLVRLSGVRAHDLLFGDGNQADNAPLSEGVTLTKEDWDELFATPEAKSLSVRDRYYIMTLLETRPDRGLASVVIRLIASHPPATRGTPKAAKTLAKHAAQKRSRGN